MAFHNKVGEWGERVALDYFLRKGYAIVAKNDVEGIRGNEIDLVVSKGSRIIFVEIKTRTSDNDDPIFSITKKKQANILRAGIAYLHSHPTPLEPQFDLFFINGTEEKYQIEHIEDVFTPPLIVHGSGGPKMDN